MKSNTTPNEQDNTSKQKMDCAKKPTPGNNNEDVDSKEEEEETNELDSNARLVVRCIRSVMGEGEYDGLSLLENRHKGHPTGLSNVAIRLSVEAHGVYQKLEEEMKHKVRKTLESGMFKNQEHKILAFLDVVIPGCLPNATSGEQFGCKVLSMLAPITNNLTSTGENPFYTSNEETTGEIEEDDDANGERVDEIGVDNEVSKFWLEHEDEHQILLDLFRKMGLEFAGKRGWRRKCNVVKVFRDKIRKAKKGVSGETTATLGELQCLRMRRAHPYKFYYVCSINVIATNVAQVRMK